MKTLEEVEERIETHTKDSTNSLMIAMCNGAHPLMFFAPKYLKPKAKPLPLTKEAVIKEMKAYISFAFRKAHGERGLSAQRSIWKFRQWLWLIEDYELLSFAQEETNYPMYGLPILRKIAKKYGFNDPL